MGEVGREDKRRKARRDANRMYWFSIISCPIFIVLLTLPWLPAWLSGAIIIFLSELALFFEAKNARMIVDDDIGTGDERN